MKAHRRPPSRLLTLAGVLLAGVLLVALVQAVNLLRHPMPDDLPAVPEAPEADPRTEIVCEEPQPVEGEPRDRVPEPRIGPPGPPARVTSNDLLDCPQTYHQALVRYEGEVVGAVLRRDAGAWAQLNDDVYAGVRGPLPAHRDYAGGNAGIGVLLPRELADAVEVVGGPQFRGDVLEIVGEFRRIDPERREAAVIVATEGRVVRPGRPIQDPVLPERRVIALALTLLAVAVAAGERVVARRR